MAKYFDRERRQDSGVRIISLPIYQALSNNMKKISKREFFKIGSTIGVGASLPAASSGNEKIAEEVSFSNDLLDENFHSPSGRHFGTQVIHHGEEPGYQVTPISQDKASPQYQRPGNMANPTVAAILRKVIEAEGAEDAVGGSCGMGIISQTYMSLLKPGDRIVTSGHGGVFPVGLPVGLGDAVNEGGISVLPFVPRDRLEYVRILDFGLKGIINNDVLDK